MTILELELEQELVNLKTRVQRLEATVHQLVGDGQQVEPPAPGELLDHGELLAWLEAEGLVVKPPPMVRIHAERWRSRTEEEKQAIRQELDHLPPGPMASAIIIENRR